MLNLCSSAPFPTWADTPTLSRTHARTRLPQALELPRSHTRHLGGRSLPREARHDGVQIVRIVPVLIICSARGNKDGVGQGIGLVLGS